VIGQEFLSGCVAWSESSSTHFFYSRLDLTKDTAYMGSRRLLKEGAVTKAKSGRKLQLVLCNDIIVLLESRNLYRMVR
jgi:hypothetical protein